MNACPLTYLLTLRLKKLTRVTGLLVILLGLRYRNRPLDDAIKFALHHSFILFLYTVHCSQLPY